jgi:hypothetical protein
MNVYSGVMHASCEDSKWDSCILLYSYKGVGVVC